GGFPLHGLLGHRHDRGGAQLPGDRRGRHGGAVLLPFLCLCLALAGTAHPALLHPAAQDQMGRLGVGHPLGAELPDRFAERQGQPAVRPGRLLPLLWQGAVRLVPGYHPWLQAPQRVGKPLEISRICPTAGLPACTYFPKEEYCMKLITAIVNKEDSKAVCNELLRNKFYVTRLATTGGFLMAG